MKPNKCALCLLPNSLQRSHYVPKGVYKVVGRGGPSAESQSVAIDLDSGTARYSNYQPMKFLLCRDCEHRFSTLGEDHVIPDLLTHSGFPLRDRYFLSDRDESMLTNSGIDFESFAYFSLSIIWRGSATLWPSPYDGIYGKLKQHEELFRKFLEGTAEFPHRTYITVLVDSEDQNIHGIIPPGFHSEIYEGHRLRVFTFQLPGVIFRVFTGSLIPPTHQKWLSTFNLPIGFMKTDFSKLQSYQNSVRQAQKHVPVGKKMKEFFRDRKG